MKLHVADAGRRPVERQAAGDPLADDQQVQQRLADHADEPRRLADEQL